MTVARSRIGVQLYSVRDQLSVRADEMIEVLATIGFEGVETAFRDPATDLAPWAARFDRVGLDVAAAHVPLPVTDELRQFVRRHVELLGATVVIFPGNRDEPRAQTEEGLLEIAAEFSDAAEFCDSLGVRFAVHHHWWELRRLADGRLAIERVFDMLSDDVLLQPDGYWATMVGVDLAELERAFAGRMPVHHIKDGPARDAVEPMTALGKGRVDLDVAIRLASGATWWIAELSHSGGDMLDDLRTSFQYLDARRGRV